jgi:NADPH2:quinone reductase
MQAYRIVADHPGGVDVLRREDFDLAPPQPDEALLRHTAIGLNYIDTHHRNGRYKRPSYPTPLGVEAAGVVEQVGSAVSGIKVGDRVVYASMSVGAYSDRRCMPADRLIPIPAGLDDRMAVAALNKGLTAHFLSHTTHVIAAGETILVQAAAGGVGMILCQWAKHMGARVIGTVGDPAKQAFALAHGCDSVVLSTATDWVESVRDLTDGRGVAVAYDAVGPATFDGSLRCLARRGLLVSFGTASGPLPPLDLFRLNAMGSLYVTSPGFADHTPDRAELLARAADLFAAIADGTLRIPIGATYALSDVARAHEDLQARRTIGASILLP